MPFFQCTPVNGRLAAQALAGGPFHLAAQPQDAINIVAVLDSHLVNLHQQVLQADESDIARIFIIILTGSRHRAVI